MEEKKSKKANLQKKRILYLEIGLIIALVVAIAVFMWGRTRTQEKEMQPDIPYRPGVMEMAPVTREEKPKGAPTRQSNLFPSDVFQIIDNDRKIAQEIDFNEYNETDIFVEPSRWRRNGDTAGRRRSFR